MLKELAKLLIDNDISFSYSNSGLYFKEIDTGYYGIVETKVLYNYYNNNTYTVFHAFPGYPSSNSFKTKEEVRMFLMSYIDEL